jgi:hypothetical protein
MHIDPPSKKNPLVPPEIDDIVMTALARDPDRRWQHATALRTALTTLTHRLDLVATNAQVVQWLDGAFAHASKRHDRAQTDTDTETDGQPIHDSAGDTNDPAAQRTVNLMPAARKVMLAMRDGAPPPPLKTPLGTPAYVPAQGASMPSAVEPPPAPPAMPPSVPSTARARPSSAAPLVASPMALPASPISQPMAATASTTPGLAVAPSPAVQSFRPAPGPMLPVSPAASPAAPRLSTRSPAAPQPYDPVRSEMVQRDFAQRVSALSTEPAAPAWRGHALAVVLVVLAAAIVAITAYFLLPLLT